MCELSKDQLPPREVQDFNDFFKISHGPRRTSHHKHKGRPRKRGKRGGLLVRLRKRTIKPPVPSIIMANVQRLYNKTDELFCRIKCQKDFRDCCVFSFCETWLRPSHPDSAVQPDGFSLFRQDRDSKITGKSQGGGVCVCV